MGYRLLHRHQGMHKNEARAIADELVQTFSTYPYRATSQRQQRELHRTLYRVLVQCGLCQRLAEVVN